MQLKNLLPAINDAAMLKQQGLVSRMFSLRSEIIMAAVLVFYCILSYISASLHASSPIPRHRSILLLVWGQVKYDIRYSVFRLILQDKTYCCNC